MAEAFGLAASAAGIVSLGLQVYEGVASYVEGVKDRKPELSAISRQANALQAVVKTLQVAAPRIDATLTNNESLLFSSLKTVEKELWALESFLSSLQDVSGQSSKFISVLKEQKKKLVYPFHRPTLEKLQKRLESANDALQTSLQAVNLTATTSISTTVSEVHTTVNSSQSSLMGLQSGIGSLETSMASMATSLIPTRASLGSMEGKLDLLLTEGRTENEQLESNFQAVHTNVGHVSHKMQQTMNMVQMSTGAIYEGFQHHSGEISQLQDLILKALSQSAAREMEMKEATEALNRKIITLSRLSDGTNTAANSSRPAVVLGRLLSKPSELKDAYEFNHVVASHASRQPEVASSAARQTCPCQSRTITQYWVKKFGDFYTSRKTTARSTHLPSCEFQAYGSQVTTDTTTMSYTGFRKLLSLSLELSFSWTSGAGGLSMSPNITLRPMVDETKSPVFRLIKLIKNNSEDLIEMTNIEPSTLEQFLNRSVDSILRLYRSKNCSPYDVDHEGQSVLYKWVELFSSLVLTIWSDHGGSDNLIEIFSLASGSSMRRLMSRVSASGILFDYHGNSPLDYIGNEGKYALDELLELSEAATELCSYDNEITIRIHDGLKGTGSMIKRETLHFWHNTKVNFPIMAEIMGLGPLSKSLLTGDRARLRSILDTDLSVLEEQTFDYQTPFHLAALSSSPEPLKALLDAARDGSTQFDSPDGNGQHVLEIAASTSLHVCRNGNSYQLCTDCSCSLPFNMLQFNGWRLSSKTKLSPCKLLRTSSQAVRMYIILEIKRVREELRAIALRSFSPHTCQRLQLNNPRIPDGYLQSIVRILFKTDLDIPDEYEDLVSEILQGSRRCIYHDLVDQSCSGTNCLRLAEFLFHSGFRDVDHEDARGKTPLLSLVERNPIETSAELVLWFVQRGAQLSRVIPGSLNKCHTTLAHQVLRLKDLSYITWKNYSAIAEVISLIAPLRLTDECRCACYGAGCTTTTIFFRHLWDIFFRKAYMVDLQHNHEAKTRFQGARRELFTSEFDYLSNDDNREDNSVEDGSLDLNHGNDIDTDDDTSSQGERLDPDSSWDYDQGNGRMTFGQRIRQLSIFLQLLGVDFVQWDHVSLSALKMFTFEALELKHTCCHRLTQDYQQPDRWARWVDASPLCDEEVAEIEEEDRELICLLDDLVNDFVAELRTCGDTFQRFLICYWAPRMEGVLADLKTAKPSPEQMFAAEQAGVIWESSSESEEEEQEEKKEYYCPPSPTLSEKFDLLMEQMDEIVVAATQTDST